MTFLRAAHQQGVDAIAMLVDLARHPPPVSSPGSPCVPAEPHKRKSPSRPPVNGLRLTSPRRIRAETTQG